MCSNMHTCPQNTASGIINFWSCLVEGTERCGFHGLSAKQSQLPGSTNGAACFLPVAAARLLYLLARRWRSCRKSLHDCNGGHNNTTDALTRPRERADAGAAQQGRAQRYRPEANKPPAAGGRLPGSAGGASLRGSPQARPPLYPGARTHWARTRLPVPRGRLMLRPAHSGGKRALARGPPLQGFPARRFGRYAAPLAWLWPEDAGSVGFSLLAFRDFLKQVWNFGPKVWKGLSLSLNKRLPNDSSSKWMFALLLTTLSKTTFL